MLIYVKKEGGIHRVAWLRLLGFIHLCKCLQGGNSATWFVGTYNNFAVLLTQNLFIWQTVLEDQVFLRLQPRMRTVGMEKSNKNQKQKLW